MHISLLIELRVHQVYKSNANIKDKTETVDQQYNQNFISFQCFLHLIMLQECDNSRRHLDLTTNIHCKKNRYSKQLPFPS